MKVGLVLGAGGVQGGAWLTGGLDALADATGWDPAKADAVVGTSAGSMIGSLIAAGLPPWFLVAGIVGAAMSVGALFVPAIVQIEERGQVAQDDSLVQDA